MFDDVNDAANSSKRNVITPGEDLESFSLDDLNERKTVLLTEIERIDDITEKKRTGLSAADAVFKV
jgi:uncharacterized small protein (DUF1192 family)